MWNVPILWISDSLKRRLLVPPNRSYLPFSPVTLKPSRSDSLGIDFAYFVNIAHRHLQSPTGLPEPGDRSPLHLLTSSTVLLPYLSSQRKTILKDCLCAVYPNATFSHFASCSFSLLPLLSFLDSLWGWLP